MLNKKNMGTVTASINAAGSTAELKIYGPIGSFWSADHLSAKEFTDELDKLPGIQNIILRINSPGGDVIEGLGIFNSLLAHPAKVDVFIEGAALSIASVIAMAGDSISIAKNSLFMIHNPYAGAYGDAVEMRKIAKVLDRYKDSLIVSYQRKVDLTDAELWKLLDDETWYDAEEAIEAGFVDTLTEDVKLDEQIDNACFDLSKFNYKKSARYKIKKNSLIKPEPALGPVTVPPPDPVPAPDPVPEPLAEPLNFDKAKNRKRKLELLELTAH